MFDSLFVALLFVNDETNELLEFMTKKKKSRTMVMKTNLNY